MPQSHCPPETKHLSWVSILHVLVQHTMAADDLTDCKEKLNVMVETWHGKCGLLGLWACKKSRKIRLHSLLNAIIHFSADVF